MKIRLAIPLLLLAAAFLFQWTAAAAQAGNDFAPGPQNQPRPTPPRPPTAKPRHYEPPPADTPTFPAPTRTPTRTPTVTQTMDLSFDKFFTATYSTDTPTNTPVPVSNHDPEQITATNTLPVAYSGPVQTLTPVPDTFETVKNGIVIPVGIVVVIFMGILTLRGFLLRRF